MGLFDFFKKQSNQQQNIGMKVEISTPKVSFETDEVIPIEKRIKGQPPTCDGLYPHEILVLSYSPHFVVNGENSFAGFWWYKYGIKDVMKIVESLKGKGLIQIGSVKDAVNMEKLPAIKEELKKRGLKVSGKKEELVTRLLENATEEELNTVFLKRPFQLTDTGSELLKKYEWIPFIHSNNIEDLDIWNLTALVQQPPYTKYRDKIWGYLNQRGGVHMKEGNFGLYRNSRFTISEFVASEGKKDIAFGLLCEVVAYDLSGLYNGFRMDFLDMYSKFFFPYENSNHTIAPEITKRIQEYGEEFGWSSDELRQQLVTGISKIKLPFRLFTNEECADIIMAEIVGDKDKLNVIYHQAEVRFKQQYKNK